MLLLTLTSIWWCLAILIGVLFLFSCAFPWWPMMWSIFLYSYLPSVYLPCWSGCYVLWLVYCWHVGKQLTLDINFVYCNVAIITYYFHDLFCQSVLDVLCRWSCHLQTQIVLCVPSQSVYYIYFSCFTALGRKFGMM